MILTVTPNTALDQTLFVDKFEAGKTLRATHAIIGMGGKPTDASWILGELGIPSVALGFAGGVNGQKVAQMLAARGVKPHFVQVDGETRLNTVIVARKDKWQTTITTSTLHVQPRHVEALRAQYSDALKETTCVIIGGTVPNGVETSLFSEFIGMARQQEIPVIFDAAEPNLSAGLAAQPTYIKPNRDELSGFVGRAVVSMDEVYAAGREIVERWRVNAIVSLGHEGGMAVLTDKAYRIPPLPIETVSPAGAGDAILAGLAASIHRGEPIEAGLRLGFAAAAAVVILPGTADCRKADVERFRPQIELIPYP